MPKANSDDYAPPIDVVTPDNPRIVQRQSDGARARVTDQGEYVSMTTGMGYRDITDDPGHEPEGAARPAASKGGLQSAPANTASSTTTAGGSTS